MWKNDTIYNGDLFLYKYPVDKEVGELLKFLKQVKSKKRIFLSDVPRANAPLPPIDYDVYIICIFGEAVDDDFVDRLDQSPAFVDKQLIVLTSQFYKEPKFARVNVFYLEHIHTIIPFLPKPTYTKLGDRKYTHGVLSNRNAIHKTVTIAKLLDKFNTDVQYSFCNTGSTEYSSPADIQGIMQGMGILLNEQECSTIQSLHDNPVTIPGKPWDVDNCIYHNSKLMWTVESIFVSHSNGATAYLTEKTMKSIITGSCFILVSQRHSLERLKSLGFETFEDVFDLSYDNFYDSTRYQKIFELIDNFNLYDQLGAAQDKADYNHNYFYNDFYKRIEQDNSNRVEEIINYINAI